MGRQPPSGGLCASENLDRGHATTAAQAMAATPPTLSIVAG
jgi:hypothetical protein